MFFFGREAAARRRALLLRAVGVFRFLAAGAVYLGLEVNLSRPEVVVSFPKRFFPVAETLPRSGAGLGAAT